MPAAPPRHSLPCESHSIPHPARPGQKRREGQGSRFSPILLRRAPDRFMGSSARLSGRKRSVHEILGGGILADVVLWRRRDASIGIVLGMLAAWLIFERSGYTLLSFVSNVLLLLISILFTWAKAAAILNRLPPPIPEMHLTEEVMNEAAVRMRSHVNMALLAFQDIALGKDSKLFYRVAISLWLISIIGGLSDFLTLVYTSLVIILTIPVLYERYEDFIDRYMKLACMEVQMYKRTYAEYFQKVKYWIVDKKKLS
ncbi:reticulon-like protein B12 isoform X2 [Phoenix dactylifera]|uniref:Reticulon-like protein n=1 Tax=Phoenix dactylifera TaxID=42345 RepID=A0A8B8J8P2_PHODC|nr:reticulon-like protein B12 isoform X2 [Phoenix dactylifera]